jgi:transglutaminase-like putative cysteine protease
MSLWSALLLWLRPPAIPPPRPSLTLFFWLIGTFFLTLLPEVTELPIWLGGVIVGALLVRAVLEFYRLPMPSLLFTSLLAVCLFIGVILQFQTIAGRQAGTTLMAGLMAIKFYELRGPRDVSVIIFSSLFIVTSALLYSQALELFVYCLIMMWLLTAALLRNSLGDRPEDELLPMLRQSGLVFLQALPLAVFLFFFFPRYTDKLQITLHDAPVGLTDHVSPGSVARLASNDELAMYVRFINNSSAPAPETMYWRGLVLWDYHNGEWTPGKMGALPLRDPPVKDPESTDYHEEITVLPHNQSWLFALDYPVSRAVNEDASEIWSDSGLFRGGILQLTPPQGHVDHTERYTVTSASQLAPLDAIAPGEDTAGTQLPELSPDVVDLANRLYASNHDPGAYIVAVLHYFHEQGFTYTVFPGVPPPGRDWLSYFLFTSKAGYCEHFASAFAVLMRIEKIPARLVVGYQGADINPYDNVYTVRQSNAHSWDEVWIESKKRWIRIDPTSILPPGLANFAPNDSSQSQQDPPLEQVHRPSSFSDTYLPAWANRALLDIEMRRQQIEVGWDDWVFAYNPDTQSRFARSLHLGMESFAFLSAVAVVLSFFAYRQLMRRRVVLTPVESLYAKFCRSMAQRGVPRAKWEGPLAYTDRVAETFPEKKEAIQHLGSLVARSRYGPDPVEASTPKELQALLDQIAAAQAAAASHE